MRIQHNVTALNAYRNLRGNNLNLAKNLEKLSSGYRINRAGDDAAGLAISEKMRAQISGLDSAKKNAEDGISLVQTAEGALTEVHSMLNRMVTLATQSANGTYDNEVDRANLQKEVTALKSEIDRISESANFNGIKLLDGSMSDEAITRGEIKTKMATSITAEDLNAVAGKQEATLVKNDAIVKGQKVSFSINYKDESGVDQVKTFTFTVGDGSAANKTALIAEDGTKYADLAAVDKFTDVEAATALRGELAKDKELNKLFTIGQGTAAKDIAFEAKTKGLSGATVTGVSQYVYNADGALTAADHDTIKVVGKVAASDAGIAYDLSKAKVFGNATDAANHGVQDINQAMFEINGEKFVFVNSALTAEQWQDVLKSGAHHVSINTEAATAGLKPEAVDIAEMTRKISEVTGLQAEAGKVANGVFSISTTAGDNVKLRLQHSGKAVDKSLTLQIGDTAEDFNKMKVSVQSTSTGSLGIKGVDISTQAGAAEAIGKIKNAINTVSSVRGDLGALQNRLEHTINNLGVMHENITDAESRIRDTDMAKEMMAYAKNNILVQSSTAMLAQANQLPQSVLQLLQ